MQNPNANSSFILTETPMIRLIVDVCVNVEEVDVDVDVDVDNILSISPNPTSGNFTITIDSDTQESKTITIKNVIGQKIITKELTSESSTKQDISLANYDKGI